MNDREEKYCASGVGLANGGKGKGERRKGEDELGGGQKSLRE